MPVAYSNGSAPDPGSDTSEMGRSHHDLADLIDVLLRDHARIRRLCIAVQDAEPSGKGRAFAALERLVTRHEFADRATVHPATRDRTPTGDPDLADAGAHGAGPEPSGDR